MRPDRIIVGEVRGTEAQDLMTAMNIGKYCMGTLHASTARETIIRLQNEPMNVPQMLINLVDVIIIMRRYATEGKVRRVVGELVETAGMERETVLLSPFLSYDTAKGGFVDTGISSVYRDRLAQVSGRPAKDILEEVERRAMVMKALAERNITDFKAVTMLCRHYVRDPRAVMEELKINHNGK